MFRQRQQGSILKIWLKAAPVLWNSAITKKGTPVRGLVCISGNANACTGEQGIKDNELMAQAMAWLMGVEKKKYLRRLRYTVLQCLWKKY